MNDLYRTVSVAVSRAYPLLVVSVLLFGLTGCYTQLQTAETAQRARTPSPTVQDEAPPPTDEPMYADEYRREYRTEGSDLGTDYAYGTTDRVGDALYEYKYQYKYKYGSPYQYRSGYGGWCDDAFFHDPWYYDSWCGPSHGSRFSLSFQFGSPYYYSHRPWARRYYSSWYGYGGWPYSNYYFGNQYYYYDGGDRPERDRTYAPRRATIGRGTTQAGGTTSANRSVARTARGTTQGVHSSSSGGRIGRRGTAEPRRERVGRTSSDRSPRSWAVERPARTRSGDGRIGRTRSTVGQDAPARRTTRARSGERTTRTRGEGQTRTRRRPSDDDGRRSEYRTPTRSWSSPSAPEVRRRASDQTRTRTRTTRPRSRQSSGRVRSRSANSETSSRARTTSRDRSRSESSSSSRSRSRGSSEDDGGSR